MSFSGTPRRVAIISNFYPPHVVGGAELVVRGLARWLGARGHEVTVIATCGPGEEPAEVEAMDGSTRVVRLFPRNLWWNYERFAAGDRRGPAARAAWNLRDQWNADAHRRVGCILDHLRPDLVHTHNLKGFSPAVWGAAARRRLPIVHTAHDYYLLCNRGVMLRGGVPCQSRCAPCAVAGAWRGLKARLVDHLCAPSNFMLGHHVRAGIAGSRGRSVVPNGVPAPARPRLRARSERRPLRLLFLGQVREEKGAAMLPAILAALPEGAATIDVAGTGEAARALRAVAEVDPRLRLHGFASGAAKEALLETADALLFPSLWPENAPLSIAEALARGLPVLGSDIGGVPEFVRDGASGLLAPAGDTAAFAAAALRLRDEPGLLAALSAGAARAGAALTEDAMGQAYLSIYGEACAGCAGPEWGRTAA